MDNLFLEDESSDKKYFTQIPNFIANHSTAIDQALYFQLKRYAGEKGTCFASQKTLLEKLGIGQKAFYKSIKYLVDHKWISFAGYKSVVTAGGTQKIKAYRINDIWKMNMEYYQGVAESAPLTSKGVAESNLRGSQKDVQGVAESGTNKNKRIRIREKELSPNGADVNNLIALFEGVNPQFQALFPRKHERDAMEWMLKKYGAEKCEATIKALPAIINQPYAPRITTPRELKENLGKLVAFYNQEKGIVNKNKIKVVSY